MPAKSLDVNCYSKVVCSLLLSWPFCYGCTPKESGESAMRQTREVQASQQFAPHPGKVVLHYQWNHSDKTQDAADIPDGHRFIYYDAQGSETSDASLATTRVPIVEVTTVSVDRNGTPVEPRHAAVITITEFGPDHRQLRHTSARMPPQQQ